MFFVYRKFKEAMSGGVKMTTETRVIFTGSFIVTKVSMAVLAKIRGVGRIVFCSFHAPTGVTCNEYMRECRDVKKLTEGKWQQYPCVSGVDINEEIKWHEDEQVSLALGNSNFQEFVDVMQGMKFHVVQPRHDQLHAPTHFPRDETRQGRQIDAFFVRGVKTEEVNIDAERRKTINTDHAALVMLCKFNRTARHWGEDSRPRWVCKTLGGESLVDWEDVVELARTHTRPSVSSKYKDPEEVQVALRDAKDAGDKAAWKRAYRLRRTARRSWQRERRARALAGDWTMYRAIKREKTRRSGWWGKLLLERTDEQLTAEVEAHLTGKLHDAKAVHWEDELNDIVNKCPDLSTWRPYSREEVAGVIASMKTKSSVGPDLVGVDLLRHLIQDESLGEQLVDLLNYHTRELCVPELWDVSWLALLAKIETPTRPNDLRPIAMSSCMQKCLNKLAMGRVFPFLRRPSQCSSCGCGRQSADVIGCVTRLRDVVKEWKLPALMAKLDVTGAFDKVRRDAAAGLLGRRALGRGVDVETRWLLRQLLVNKLRGDVPGGGTIE
eukprot:s313_g6.t1